LHIISSPIKIRKDFLKITKFQRFALPLPSGKDTRQKPSLLGPLDRASLRQYEDYLFIMGSEG
jgi:hypothetical protein